MDEHISPESLLEIRQGALVGMEAFREVILAVAMDMVKLQDDLHRRGLDQGYEALYRLYLQYLTGEAIGGVSDVLAPGRPPPPLEDGKPWELR